MRRFVSVAGPQRNRTTRWLVIVTLLVGSAALGAVPDPAQEMPTVTTVEQFAFSHQMEIPSLPPGRWAWISKEYPYFGGEYVFGDRFLVQMIAATLKTSVLWDPMTGRGRRLTEAQGVALFHATGNHLASQDFLGPPVPTSGGLYLKESVTPGETFHCHPSLSILYLVTARGGGSSRPYLFILQDPHPKLFTYRVCSEGNLPDHETTALRYHAVAMNWAMLPDGTTLGFPLSLASGAGRGCVLRFDTLFLQRTVLPGCPVQVDERLVNVGFAGESGGSPTFRAKLIQPVYEAAIKALSQ